jgi:hypothetical protein
MIPFPLDEGQQHPAQTESQAVAVPVSKRFLKKSNLGWESPSSGDHGARGTGHLQTISMYITALKC